MKILGLMLGILVGFFGGILLFGDVIYAAKTEKVGVFVSFFVTAFILSMQYILIIIAFFLPRGAGTGIMVTSLLSLIVGIFGGGIISSIVSVFMLLSGFLIKKGASSKEPESTKG